MAYAVISIGGHQEKVSKGSIVVVNRLADKTGTKLTFPCKLYVDDKEVVTDSKKLHNYQVSAKVLADDIKGPKINIMKYKNKTRYHNRMGHRQQLTRLEIVSIGVLKSSKSSDRVKDSNNLPVTKKPVTANQPIAKKPTTKKIPTKKTIAKKSTVIKSSVAKKTVAEKKSTATKSSTVKKPTTKKSVAKQTAVIKK
ncbi:MAG: 50S ribosomal protein L21 [Bifidobacteriaceae bacterium]|jgi:large subunit ribosomal protein L21|nr:50S ribosomal protein L21 [Bifidobacteriaceae bacterium]